MKIQCVSVICAMASVFAVGCGKRYPENYGAYYSVGDEWISLPAKTSEISVSAVEAGSLRLLVNDPVVTSGLVSAAELVSIKENTYINRTIEIVQETKERPDSVRYLVYPEGRLVSSGGKLSVVARPVKEGKAMIEYTPSSALKVGSYSCSLGDSRFHLLVGVRQPFVETLPTSAKRDQWIRTLSNEQFSWDNWVATGVRAGDSDASFQGRAVLAREMRDCAEADVLVDGFDREAEALREAGNFAGLIKLLDLAGGCSEALRTRIRDGIWETGRRVADQCAQEKNYWKALQLVDQVAAIQGRQVTDEVKALHAEYSAVVQAADERLRAEMTEAALKAIEAVEATGGTQFATGLESMLVVVGANEVKIGKIARDRPGHLFDERAQIRSIWIGDIVSAQSVDETRSDGFFGPKRTVHSAVVETGDGTKVGIDFRFARKRDLFLLSVIKSAEGFRGGHQEAMQTTVMARPGVLGEKVPSFIRQARGWPDGVMMPMLPTRQDDGRDDIEIVGADGSKEVWKVGESIRLWRADWFRFQSLGDRPSAIRIDRIEPLRPVLTQVRQDVESSLSKYRHLEYPESGVFVDYRSDLLEVPAIEPVRVCLRPGETPSGSPAAIWNIQIRTSRAAQRGLEAVAEEVWTQLYQSRPNLGNGGMSLNGEAKPATSPREVGGVRGLGMRYSWIVADNAMQMFSPKAGTPRGTGAMVVLRTGGYDVLIYSEATAIADGEKWSARIDEIMDSIRIVNASINPDPDQIGAVRWCIPAIDGAALRMQSGSDSINRGVPPAAGTPAAPAPANRAQQNESDSRFVGKWAGVVQQPGSSPYSVVIVLRAIGSSKEVGTVDYPTLKCGGELELRSRSTGKLELVERLRGTGDCVDGGAVRLEIEANGSLAWTWFLPDGREGARALLIREAP